MNTPQFKIGDNVKGTDFSLDGFNDNFRATVMGYRGKYVEVKDYKGDVWVVYPEQITLDDEQDEWGKTLITIVEEVSDKNRLDWNDHSIKFLLAAFIEKTSNQATFEKFIAEIAADEVVALTMP